MQKNYVSIAIEGEKMTTEIILAIFGSTGLWTLVNNVVQRMQGHKSAERKALLALLHDRLYLLCQSYIEQGSISLDELENIDYLYSPYRALGGNGTCEKLYEKVLSLPIERK